MRKPLVVHPVASGALEGALRPLIAAPLDRLPRRLGAGHRPGGFRRLLGALARALLPLRAERS